ncbi:hypothetical protein L873DRAFT_1788504 [Choiromyces venosus 120613-1]|uniref:Uncharacterized protein n=1 Tax=Choiromyces venosus 120613-1 TaxID=1336337 RepID=A0A3N4JS72_9PEZI|nr:hypothetical protein L873DRAFT_1788504 [Choiromyces venosus 120613-1]
MPPPNPLTALPPLLSLLFLPPTVLLFWNFALLTTILSSIVLLFRLLRVYFEVCTTILLERFRGTSTSTSRKDRWQDSRRRRSSERLEVWREEEEEKVEEEMMGKLVGRVNYATLIRPLEPVEWRVRRRSGAGLEVDEWRVRGEGWDWNGW